MVFPASNEQPTNNSRSSNRSSIERPMKIEMVLDPSKPLPLASRVAPAPAAAKTAATRFVNPRGSRLNSSSHAPSRTSIRGRRVRGRGGARKSDRPPKTAADLDAEMEVSKSLVLQASRQSLIPFYSGLHRRQRARRRCHCCLKASGFVLWSSVHPFSMSSRLAYSQP